MRLAGRTCRYRSSWIDYSARDAKATWELREALHNWLAATP